MNTKFYNETTKELLGEMSRCLLLPVGTKVRHDDSVWIVSKVVINIEKNCQEAYVYPEYR